MLLFQWDNYLSVFLEKYGGQVTHCYFATHNEGDEPRHVHVQFVAPWELPGNLRFWLSKGTKPFIVNVDLDYFMYPASGEVDARFFSADYFLQLFAELKAAMDDGTSKSLTFV
jgi:hypothetical protein